jgi:hypothetical protein
MSKDENLCFILGVFLGRLQYVPVSCLQIPKFGVLCRQKLDVMAGQMLLPLRRPREAGGVLSAALQVPQPERSAIGCMNWDWSLTTLRAAVSLARAVPSSGGEQTAGS